MTFWTILGVLGAATIFVSVFHAYRYYSGLRKIRRELSNFNYVQEYDAYMDAQPEFYVAQKKKPYGVLLLHGFSLSAQAYSTLFGPLKESEINFYAITYTGYGIQSPHLLENITYKDWLRDTVDAYDLLSQTVEKVHVIGSSLGAAYALMLSRYRPISKMILLSPALFLEPELRWLVWLGDVPIIRRIGWWFYPFYTKKLRDPSSPNSGKLELYAVQSLLRTFHHETFPIPVAIAIDQALRNVNIVLARFKKLYILYGEKDQVVNVQVLFSVLQKHHMAYTAKAYANSTHLLTLDYDNEQVVKDIIEILKEPI